MDLTQLKKTIDYKWKIQSFINDKDKKPIKASCVAYIDARDVMDLLDEVCGAENWQSKFQIIRNNLFCTLLIKVGGEWIEKTDIGTPSQTEADKGEASDAFKRAAVHWGIGRFLYEKEVVWVKYDSVKKKPLDDDDKPIYNLSDYCNKKVPNKTIPKTQKSVEKPVEITKSIQTQDKPPVKKELSKNVENVIYDLEQSGLNKLAKDFISRIQNKNNIEGGFWQNLGEWFSKNIDKIDPKISKELSDLLNNFSNSDEVLANFDPNYVN